MTDVHVVTADRGPHEQTLAYFPGDGSVLWLHDKLTEVTTLGPVERAVLVTRLRTHAALIEENGYR